jgi:hypothetical protein
LFNRFSSDFKYRPSLRAYVGLILRKLDWIWLSMKAHIFERVCPLYPEG